MDAVDLRSDTVTRPTRAMREAMLDAPVGDDVMGDDPSVNALQAHVAGALGFEAGLFVPSGTMSNLLALMAHCERGDEYLVGADAHTYKYEGGGAAVLGSIQPQPIVQAADGTLPLDAVDAAIKPAGDPHFARTRLLALENTWHGRPLPLDYLAAAGAFARERGLGFHLAGARLPRGAGDRIVGRAVGYPGGPGYRIDQYPECIGTALGTDPCRTAVEHERGVQDARDRHGGHLFLTIQRDMRRGIACALIVDLDDAAQKIVKAVREAK